VYRYDCNTHKTKSQHKQCFCRRFCLRFVTAPGLTAAAIAQMQEQRKSAAVKIAVWYKRLSETKQARQSLKAHRQLLPLTSLDKRREEEEKVAAASTIVCFLQDMQRGHSFVRAVQTFHLKVRLAESCKEKRRKGKERKGREVLQLLA